MAEVFKLDKTKIVKEIAEQALDDFAYKGLTIRQWADKITTGEYQSVKHGRWIQRRNGKYYCINCGREERFIFQKNYCPNCGAKMDGDN